MKKGWNGLKRNKNKQKRTKTTKKERKGTKKEQKGTNSNKQEHKKNEEKQIQKNKENVDSESSYASSLQKTIKGGYCYIGTDRTFRSCVKVDAGDTCMSNKIFPTKDICINPNLRR